MLRSSIWLWSLGLMCLLCLPTREAWLFGGGGGEEEVEKDEEDIPVKPEAPGGRFGEGKNERERETDRERERDREKGFANNLPLTLSHFHSHSHSHFHFHFHYLTDAIGLFLSLPLHVCQSVCLTI